MTDTSSAKSELLREAEYEMRRSFPEADGRPAKRRKEGEHEVEELGRFDYSAVQELAAGTSVGFLLTCDFRREKSATKEASKLLSSYLQRLLPPAAAGTGAGGDDDGGAAGEAADEVAGAAGPSRPLLSTVKLGCRGLVFLKLSTEAAAALNEEKQQQQTQQESQQQRSAPAAQLVQAAAEELLADVDSGKVKRLEYCQRAVPVHTTCRLEAAALEAAAARVAALAAAATAVAWPAGGSVAGSEAPAGEEGGGTAGPAAPPLSISFGVGYKQRVSVEGPAKATPAATAAVAAAAAASLGGTALEPAPAAVGAVAEGAGGAAAPGPALGRMEVIHAVASAFERALREVHGIQAKVDLKAPSWVFLVEELPVAGTSCVALAALPVAMCTVKPRMGVRPVGKARPS